MHDEKTKTITGCYRPATWGRKKLLIVWWTQKNEVILQTK